MVGDAVVPPSSPVAQPESALGFRVPTEVLVLAVRWHLRYDLSNRDVEELLVERGVEDDHVTVYHSVQRFTPILADAARFCRHSPGDRWHVRRPCDCRKIASVQFSGRVLVFVPPSRSLRRMFR